MQLSPQVELISILDLSMPFGMKNLIIAEFVVVFKNMVLFMLSLGANAMLAGSNQSSELNFVSQDADRPGKINYFEY